MKRKGYLILTILMTVWLSVGTAFGQADVIGQVNETIKAGSAKELARYLNQNVDITMEGKLQTYSKAQAEFVLRDFFKANPPTEYTTIHQGSSKGGQLFAIGQYKSSGSVYQIFMKIKNVNNQQLVDDIRITKQ